MHTYQLKFYKNQNMFGIEQLNSGRSKLDSLEYEKFSSHILKVHHINKFFDLATREEKTAIFFDMLMTFKHGGKEYDGIFVDTVEKADFELEINKKVFFTVYTDKDIEELVDYLRDS